MGVCFLHFWFSLSSPIMAYQVFKQYRSDAYKKVFRTSELIINTVQGPILSQNHALLAMNNRPMVYQPFMMTELLRTGTWDQTPMLKMLKNKYYSLIILEYNLDLESQHRYFTPEMEDAIKTHYILKARVGGFHYYFASNGSGIAPSPDNLHQ